MKPTPNFDRVARIYRWAEYLTLGPLLQRTRTHFLPQLLHCRNALVLGDGDGRFLARLLLQNPRLQATAVDTSAAMLNLLRLRCQPAASRLQTQQASALEITQHAATDVIVTHFFLDCLSQPDVDRLASTLAAATGPGTLWLLSDFRVPATGPLRPLARLYIRGLYLAFRILTNLRITHLPDPAKSLTTAGFHRIAEHQSLGGILYTELWERGRATIVRKADMSDTATTNEHRNPVRPAPHLPADALPDPEPAVPSLAEPDPGVFHHDPAPVPTSTPSQK